VLIIIKTYQQHMGLEAGALQLGRARKRSLEVEEGIHGNSCEQPSTKRHCHTEDASGIFTKHRLTRKSEGKAKVNEKMQKMVIQATRNLHLQR